MALRKYCDGCKEEIDLHTIRPKITIDITSPTDGSRLAFLEFCDVCYLKFRHAITTTISQPIIK